MTINVTNVPEKPGAPAAPTVVSTDVDDDDTFDLKVIWYAPDDEGRHTYSYNLQRTVQEKHRDSTFSEATTVPTYHWIRLQRSQDWRTTHPTKCGYGPPTTRRASGPWSLSSVGSTNKEGNALPEFSAATETRNVLENSDPGLVVGFKVSATDNDNVLPLTYQPPWSGRQLVRPAGVDRADTDEERRGLRLRDQGRRSM